MLTNTLPTLDIFFNSLGSLKIDIYGQDADYEVEPEESDVVTLEDLTKEFIKHLRDPYTRRIQGHLEINAAYNLLDSLRNAVVAIELAIYEEDIDG